MVFAKALEANGLAPEQIMSGNQALERLEKSVPTLVILDLHLPVVPGPEILRKIRADDRMNDTLVVVVTADPRMADMIREDADLVLLKPTTFSQVRDLVGRLMAVRGRGSAPSEPVPEPAASPAPAPVAAEPAVSAKPDPVPVAEELALVSTKPDPEPEAVEPVSASAKAEPAPEAEPAPVPADPDSAAPAPAARASSGRGSKRTRRK